MPLSPPATVRDTFPAFAAIAGNAHPAWALPADWADEQILEPVARLIDDHIQTAAASAERVQTLGRAILSDLRQLQRGLTGDALVQSHYLQLHIGVCLMDLGRQTGMLGITYDWIILSLSEHEAHEQEVVFDYPRFAAVLASPHYLLALNGIRLVLGWYELLYYYSRLQGAHRGVAADLLQGCLAAFRGAWERLENAPAGGFERRFHASAFDSAVGAILQAIPWAGKNRITLSDDPRPLLERAYEAPRVSARTRASIGLYFTTQFGALGGRRAVWARRTLLEFAGVLIGHERLQLMLAGIDSLADAREPRAAILGEIRRVAGEHLTAAGGDYPLFCYGQARLFDVLAPLVRVLADSGQCNELLEVVSAWYAVPPGAHRTGPYLLCVGSHEDGVLYATEGRILLLTQDQDASMARLTEAGNHFFSTNVTLVDTPGLNPHVPERAGAPVSRAGAGYEEAVRAHYRISELAAAFTILAERAEGLVTIHGTRDPLPALIAAATGRALPLITSFRPPRADRPVRRVAVWSGGTYLSSLGLSAAVEYLSSRGVTCDVVPDDRRSAEEFCRLYESPDYDVLWVNAHAEYDHTNPHAVYLRLFPGDETGVALSSLTQLRVPTAGRRLLFLNVCDGGTAAPMPGPSKLGLAPMLASPGQAVVSHLWPVEQTVAILLDVLLAVALVRAPDFSRPLRSQRSC